MGVKKPVTHLFLTGIPRSKKFHLLRKIWDPTTYECNWKENSTTLFFENVCREREKIMKIIEYSIPSEFLALFNNRALHHHSLKGKLTSFEQQQQPQQQQNNKEIMSAIFMNYKCCTRNHTQSIHLITTNWTHSQR